MSEAWIIDACRTPRGVGRIGKGALTNLHPQQLGATVLAAIGATGAMLVGTVLDELERRDRPFGLVTMCTGGGMAPAIIIERI